MDRFILVQYEPNLNRVPPRPKNQSIRSQLKALTKKNTVALVLLHYTSIQRIMADFSTSGLEVSFQEDHVCRVLIPEMSERLKELIAHFNVRASDVRD